MVFTRQVTPRGTVSASSCRLYSHVRSPTCHRVGIKLSGQPTCHRVGIKLSMVFTRQVTPHVTVSASSCRLSSHVRSPHMSPCRHQVVDYLHTSGHPTCHRVGIKVSMVVASFVYSHRLYQVVDGSRFLCVFTSSVSSCRW